MTTAFSTPLLGCCLLLAGVASSWNTETVDKFGSHPLEAGINPRVSVFSRGRWVDPDTLVEGVLYSGSGPRKVLGGRYVELLRPENNLLIVDKNNSTFVELKVDYNEFYLPKDLPSTFKESRSVMRALAREESCLLGVYRNDSEMVLRKCLPKYLESQTFLFKTPEVITLLRGLQSQIPLLLNTGVFLNQTTLFKTSCFDREEGFVVRQQEKLEEGSYLIGVAEGCKVEFDRFVCYPECRSVSGDSVIEGGNGGNGSSV